MRVGTRLRPDFESAYASRGECWRRKSDLDKALDDLNKAVQLQTSPWAPTYLVRGWFLEEKGACDKAVADYDRATQIDPRVDDAFSCLA
jgi:tetratricopeptide (TPR) repeat protein